MGGAMREKESGASRPSIRPKLVLTAFVAALLAAALGVVALAQRPASAMAEGRQIGTAASMVARSAQQDGAVGGASAESAQRDASQDSDSMAAASAPSDAEGEASSFGWTMESDCAACHTDEAQSYEDTNCLASQHADVACTTCHADEVGLADRHDDVEIGDRTPRRLRATEVDTQACVTCHGDYEALAQATAGVTVLTDENGTTVNPHEVTTTVNAAGQHDEITCVDCHAMHVDEPSADQAVATCRTCHHADVYECGTCHE